MRIIQLLPTISYGDAIGNHCMALKKLFESYGYETMILSNNIDTRIVDKSVKQYNNLFEFKTNDILIYHLAIGDKLNKKIKNIDCKKIIIYHNITPFKYFNNYNEGLKDACKKGIKEVKKLSKVIDYCIADSEFNKIDLIKLGYKCKIDVCPILINFEDYNKEPNPNVIKKYTDDYINILFTGRIAPNKKIEDIISVYYYYKKFINPKSRLILVGNYNSTEKYYFKLLAYIKKLKLNDVIFTGHIPFDQVLSYYKLANVFLCMSEHEGFCVPLVESMYFDVPIIARDTSAIADTLGDSGILLPDNHPIIAAKFIDRIISDKKLKKHIIKTQQVRLKFFDNKRIEKTIMEMIQKFIKNS